MSLYQCMFVHFLFHVQVLIPSVICLKGLTASPIHQFLPTFRLYPPASSFLPSFLLSSPPSSHTIPLWRGIVIIHSDMFWCCCFFLFLLSVECWYSPTHSLSLHLSKSLTPSISTFPRERESEQKRERERYCMVWYFCGSHYVNLLFVCLCLFTV